MNVVPSDALHGGQFQGRWKLFDESWQLPSWLTVHDRFPEYHEGMAEGHPHRVGIALNSDGRISSRRQSSSVLCCLHHSLLHSVHAPMHPLSQADLNRTTDPFIKPGKLAVICDDHENAGIAESID